MERVPRKKGKTVPRWLVLAVVLALVVGSLMLGSLLKKTPPLPEGEDEGLQWLTQTAADSIAVLSLQPREGRGFSLTRTEDGFRLKEHPGWDLRADVVESMLEAAGFLKAGMTLGTPETLGVPLDAFGLAEPVLSVALTDKEGRLTEVHFGDTVPDEETAMYYCLMGDTVYAVLQEPCYDLFHEAEYLRFFEQPKLQTDLLDQIRVEGDIRFTLRYTPDGFMMETPWQYPADALVVQRLLDNIGMMAFEACLGTPEENDMDALGLSSPCLTVTLSQAASVITGETVTGEAVTLNVPEKTYTLLVGNETGKSGVYVCWEEVVYKASNFLLGFWKALQPETYLSAAPLSFPVERLHSVTIETGGVKTVYTVEMVESLTKNNEIETDEYGTPLYDALVKKNGGDGDARAFLAWYVRVNRWPLMGRVQEGFIPSGEALGKIVVRAGETERTMAFYPMDGLHVALTVGEESLFYAEGAILSLLQELP